MTKVNEEVQKILAHSDKMSNNILTTMIVIGLSLILIGVILDMFFKKKRAIDIFVPVGVVALIYPLVLSWYVEDSFAKKAEIKIDNEVLSYIKGSQVHLNGVTVLGEEVKPCSDKIISCVLVTVVDETGTRYSIPLHEKDISSLGEGVYDVTFPYLSKKDIEMLYELGYLGMVHSKVEIKKQRLQINYNNSLNEIHTT